MDKFLLNYFQLFINNAKRRLLDRMYKYPCLRQNQVHSAITTPVLFVRQHVGLLDGLVEEDLGAEIALDPVGGVGHVAMDGDLVLQAGTSAAQYLESGKKKIIQTPMHTSSRLKRLREQRTRAGHLLYFYIFFTNVK